MTAILPLLALALAFLSLFGIAEIMYNFLGVRADHTRNLVHVVTGLLTLLFPVYLDRIWQVALLCGSFLVILLASLRFGWLPSINAVNRRSHGSWLYPIVVVFCYWFSADAIVGSPLKLHPYTYYAVPLLLLAIGDPAAAIAGRIRHRRHPEAPPRKTNAGSATFFTAAFAISISCMWFLPHQPAAFVRVALHALGIALLTTLAERFGTGGWDNLTIPLCATGYFYLAEHLRIL